MVFIDVILAQNGKNLFTYKVNSKVSVCLGQRVLVPIGNKQKIGIVSDIKEKEPAFQTREIIELLDQKSLISESDFKWMEFIGQYYQVSLAEVLISAFPSSFWKEKDFEKLRNKKFRKSIINFEEITFEPKTLNNDQLSIIKDYHQKIDSRKFNVNLLHGVTGSGKTEVYVEMARHALSQDKSILILVPEIGLTPQTIRRFSHLCSDQLGTYHSQLTTNQKLAQWLACFDDKVRIIIGTRSSIFLPIRNLAAIIIDEEHDPSFKQEERFRYHARDIAILKAKELSIPIFLGSATPSLETYFHAKQTKYHLSELKFRPQQSQLPEVKLIDMKSQQFQTGSPSQMSVELYQALEKNLENKEQSIILINKRGYASSALCKSCEASVDCPNCHVSLTYHKNISRLMCHYCDFQSHLPKECPECGALKMTLVGMGTQSIEEEMRGFFPEARIERLDRDTISKKGKLFEILSDLKSGQIDIIIGTQMIAKGHDFPKVTLVGVIGADVGLGLPDFRSSERVFSLLTQVAGRSGRGESPGKVIVQTYTPHHFAIIKACDQNYEDFFEQEVKHREELNYPPCGYLIQYVFSGLNASKLSQIMSKISRLIKSKFQYKEVFILGPAPSPLSKVRNRFRWHILLKSTQRKKLHQVSRELKDELKNIIPSSVRMNVNVDPIDMI